MHRLIAVRKRGALSYLHHDHLGSTKATSGTSGGSMKYYWRASWLLVGRAERTDNLYTAGRRET